MVIKLDRDSCSFPERGDDEQGCELQSSECCFLSEPGDVVLVSSSDFFNQAMYSESLKDSGDLVPRFLGHDGARRAVLKSTDMKFSTDNAFEQLQILAAEEIKAAIGPLAIRHGLRDLLEIFDAHGRIFDGGDELQITLVSSFHQVPKDGETIDESLQRSALHLPSAIPMFYLSVVFEKTDIIDGRLNAQDDP